MSPSVDWFRKPGTRGDTDAGTLNACYNALDRHVIRGQAEATAVELDGKAWTYADLLAEVGAFAGALRAFGVGVGDHVLVGPLPGSHDVVASLAAARLGATRSYAAASADAVRSVLDGVGARVAVLPTKGDVDLGETPLITVDDSAELSWAIVMRAGRTDPAACAEVDPDSTLAASGDHSLIVLDALGDPPAAPDSAAVVDIGGLSLWVWS